MKMVNISLFVFFIYLHSQFYFIYNNEIHSHNEETFDDFIIPEIEKINLDVEEFNRQFGEDIDFHEKLENSENHLKCLNMVNVYISNKEDEFKDNFQNILDLVLKHRINVLQTVNDIYEISKYKFIVFPLKNMNITNERKIKSSLFDIIFYDLIITCKRDEESVKRFSLSEINDIVPNNNNSHNRNINYESKQSFFNLLDKSIENIKEKLIELSIKIQSDKLLEETLVVEFKKKISLKIEKDLFTLELLEKNLYVPENKDIHQSQNSKNFVKETDQFSVKLLFVILIVLSLISFLIYKSKKNDANINTSSNNKVKTK